MHINILNDIYINSLYLIYEKFYNFQSESVGDAIYAMDWTNLNPSTVKGLIIIMSRTLKPIIFTSGHIVTLSHDSFKSVSFISIYFPTLHYHKEINNVYSLNFSAAAHQNILFNIQSSSTNIIKLNWHIFNGTKKLLLL